MSAGELFREGRLAEAIAAATQAVRAAAAAAAPRFLLAELLAFAGEAERADRILDAAASLTPETAPAAARFRQLLRADLARRQLFAEGRVPEFLTEPSATQHHALAALVALRAGDAATAARAAAEAEAARPRLPGRRDGTPFDDFRDADDLLAGSLEALTVDGSYLWVAAEAVARIEFQPPRRPCDLLWRQARLALRDGTSGEVFLPALYPPLDGGPDDEQLRLGRATDWRGPPDGSQRGPVRGLGQRVYLAGRDAVAAMELGLLEFDLAGTGR